jgi:glycosyltransferase involved in cell wall biosynthesis
MSVRVAFPFVGDTIGGSHISAALLMGNLPQHGFSPVAVVHQDGPLLPLLRQRGLDCMQVDLPCLAPGAAGIPAVLKIVMMAPRLASFLRRNDFALVHANDGRMITGWMPGARFAGCKTVAHRRTRWSPSRLSDIAFSFAQEVIAISRYVETTLPDALRKKSVVIANPFEGATIARSEARARAVNLVGTDAPILAFVGTLQKQKRPDIFLRAAAIIHRKRPDIHFLLLGRDGEEGAAARRLCTELGLDGVVTFAGFRADAAELLAGCDLLLAPAVEEGHGRTLVEAMTAGVPVVAADSGGHREIVAPGRTGALVAPDDPEALAKAALALLADPLRTSRMADAARAAASANFSAAAHAQAVAQVYRELLGRT